MSEHTTIFAPEITVPPQEWRDAADFEFNSLVFQAHEDRCKCGAVHHWGDTWRVFTHKRSSGSVRRLMPMSADIPKGAEIVIFRIPPRSVPVCPKCIEATIGSQVFMVSTEEKWNEARRRSDELQREARLRRVVQVEKRADFSELPDDL